MEGAKFEQDRKFGVEIEVVGISPRRAAHVLTEFGSSTTFAESYNHVTRAYWKVVQDSSLSYSSPGETCEVVSPPLAGEEGLQQLQKVLTILRDAGAKVNRSCGFHVHWDCHDYRTKDLKSLLYLYAKFEPVLDSLVVPSRRGNLNNSCISLLGSGTAEEQLRWIKQLSERNRSCREMLYHFNNNSYDRSNLRYYKLNILSYLSYGTVEFRHHQGTLSFAKAKGWILLTQSFVTRPRRGAIRQSPSAKVSLGELFRTLKIADHHTEDRDIRWAREFWKKRYLELSRNRETDREPQ